MKQSLSVSFYKKATGQFMCHVNTMSKYPDGYLGWHIKELHHFGSCNASLVSRSLDIAKLFPGLTSIS